MKQTTPTGNPFGDMENKSAESLSTEAKALDAEPTDDPEAGADTDLIKEPTVAADNETDTPAETEVVADELESVELLHHWNETLPGGELKAHVPGATVAVNHNLAATLVGAKYAVRPA